MGASMSRTPPLRGELLFSELQRGRGAERGHEVSKRGVRLGLLIPNCGSHLPHTPASEVFRGREPVRDAQLVSYRLVSASSLCFSHPYRPLPEEGPISSSKALPRLQEQLCSTAPTHISRLFSLPISIKPSRRSLASFASVITLARYLSPWKAGCLTKTRFPCSSTDSVCI